MVYIVWESSDLWCSTTQKQSAKLTKCTTLLTPTILPCSHEQTYDKHTTQPKQPTPSNSLQSACSIFTCIANMLLEVNWVAGANTLQLTSLCFPNG